MLIELLLLLYATLSLGALWWWARVECEMPLLQRRHIEQPVLLVWFSVSLVCAFTLLLLCGVTEMLALLALLLTTLGLYLWLAARRHTVAYSCRYMARHYDADEAALLALCEQYAYTAFPVHDFVKRQLPLDEYVQALHADEADAQNRAVEAELLAYNLQKQAEAEAWSHERRQKQFI